ncbi:MAG TPA: hypothetical protein DCS89_17665 [Gammaproteobacteria bacterium]|jgi:hypothetical protein|nr:hypothetical protein [Gammaproteobacteria bacterium]HIF85464.1 hypothetical protein [Gammaproteobacteria bacterium]HIL64122.1 hypothetical protein [Porticoccaceae bacterium]|tara:strand:+ start:985 stop:2037 length:1053 start_codon:yes stop_codon:yes gene_type:complete
MNRIYRVVIGLVAVTALIGSSAQTNDSALRDRAIGYVMTDLFWSVYQTSDAKQECPRGFNDGPREQFEQLYPYHEGLTVEETQLKQEIETWHPSTEPDGFEFLEVEGEFSWGLNLDGEVGPNDFVHPDGSPGIDNEVYRAVGCVIGFRGPDGVEFIFQNKAIVDERYNRMMVELTEVDDLENDDSVTVTVYRGMDRLLTDATGSRVMPGGTQRVDRRWGQNLIRQVEARIVDSVLITEPIGDLIIPWQNLSVPSIQLFRDARFELDLSAEGATGLLAGYADVDTWYYQLIRNDSTHHLSNGQISGISLYKALRRLADAYPDPETGENTAISTALDIKMKQVFIVDESARK